MGSGNGGTVLAASSSCMASVMSLAVPSRYTLNTRSFLTTSTRTTSPLMRLGFDFRPSFVTVLRCAMSVSWCGLSRLTAYPFATMQSTIHCCASVRSSAEPMTTSFQGLSPRTSHRRHEAIRNGAMPCSSRNFSRSANSSSARPSLMRTNTRRRSNASVMLMMTGLFDAMMNMALFLKLTAFSCTRRATIVSPVPIFFSRVACSRVMVSASSS